MASPPLTCATCGLSIYNAPPTVWSDGPNREPYCDETCMRLAAAVDHSVRPAIDRSIERDHSLCGAEPCSDCR